MKCSAYEIPDLKDKVQNRMEALLLPGKRVKKQGFGST